MNLYRVTPVEPAGPQYWCEAEDDDNAAAIVLDMLGRQPRTATEPGAPHRPQIVTVSLILHRIPDDIPLAANFQEKQPWE